MRAPSVEDLAGLVTVEQPPPAMEPAQHPYEPHPGYPAWCAHCPLPREHRVHAGGGGERP